MVDALLRIGLLVAIFASVFIVSQFALNALWAKRSHLHAVNKRLRMIGQGNTREEIMAELRKNQPTEYPNLPPILARRVENHHLDAGTADVDRKSTRTFRLIHRLLVSVSDHRTLRTLAPFL